jgi:hypothetical protein
VRLCKYAQQVHSAVDVPTTGDDDSKSNLDITLPVASDDPRFLGGALRRRFTWGELEILWGRFGGLEAILRIPDGESVATYLEAPTLGYKYCQSSRPRPRR